MNPNLSLVFLLCCFHLTGILSCFYFLYESLLLLFSLVLQGHFIFVPNL